MNRRSLFKFLGIGAAMAMVAPKVLTAGESTKRGWYAKPSIKLLQERIGRIKEYPRDGQYFAGLDLGNKNSPTWVLVKGEKIVGVNSDERTNEEGLLVYVNV